jgi:hypothetical protein
MATCPHAEHTISLLYDGELQNPLRREMITHISSCVTCTRLLSFFDREQELLSQVIEAQVESVDFSTFWQGVTEKLSEPRLTWRERVRLWYESLRFMWPFPIPRWVAAAFLLFLLPTHVPPNNNTPSIPSRTELARTSPRTTVPIQRIREEDQVKIDSLDPSVTVAIRIDRENNSTILWVGDGVSADWP